MGKCYEAFGLILHANRSIPGLTPAKKKLPADISIDIKGSSAVTRPESPKHLYYRSPGDPDGYAYTVWRLENDGGFDFEYRDGSAIRLDAAGRTITVQWADAVFYEDLLTHLLGHVMGFALRLHGIVCLHASAVAIGRRAIAFLNPGGCGKSTAAAAFAQMGYPVLADDILALSDGGNRFLAQPAYPRLRLWPASVEKLFGHSAVLPRISPNHPTWDKCFLSLNRRHHRFQGVALPLAAAYTSDRSRRIAEHRVVPIPAPRAVFHLIQNSHGNHLLDKRMRAREFDVLGRLAAAVPLRCLTTRGKADTPTLSELCDMVLHDFQAMARPKNHGKPADP